MSEFISTIDIDQNTTMPLRRISHDGLANSVDVDQTDGRFVASTPKNIDGSWAGNVTIFPQSPQMEVNSPIVFNDFRQVTSLRAPYDSRFDYVRRKLWIADTGNNRVLRVNIDTQDVEIVIESILYPHALAANLNTGGVFIKAYTSESYGCVYSYKAEGVQNSQFTFLINAIGSSSSSTSSSSSDNSGSSTSDEGNMPDMPYANSIVYDHLRSRIWWVFGSKIYMVDERNYQVVVYDLIVSGLFNARSIDVELSTGNAFVVAQGIASSTWFITQMCRDNNMVLSTAYIP